MLHSWVGICEQPHLLTEITRCYNTDLKKKCTMQDLIQSKLIPLFTNGLFLLVRYNKLGIVHCTLVIILKKYCFFSCLRILFTLPNSDYPDEMPHYAAFHLGLHCLVFHVNLWLSGRTCHLRPAGSNKTC